MASEVSITFDDYSFQSDTIITESIIGDDSLPAKNLGVYELPVIDGAKKTFEHVQARRITIRGILKSTTASGLVGKMEELKEVTTREDKQLVINHPGDYPRIYTASVVGSPKIEREFHHVTIAPFQVEFICLEPWSVRTTVGVSGVYNVLGAITNISLGISGTLDPKPTLYFNTTASGTKFVVQNNTTGKSMEVTTSFSGIGRSLIIDCENFDVLLDNSPTDYRGTFPSFNPGINELKIVTVGQSGPSTDQSFEPVAFAYSSFSGSRFIAQKFVPTLSNLLYVETLLRFRRTARDIVIEIRTDNTNNPSSTILASATIPAFNSDSPSWKRAIFDSPVSLTPGSTYWIVLTVPGAPISEYCESAYATNNSESEATTRYSLNGGLTWAVTSGYKVSLAFRTFHELSSQLTGKFVVQYNPRRW